MEKENHLIEEEVNDIIGQIPPKIINYGNAIILGVLMLLLGVCFFIPIKDTQETKIVLKKYGGNYYADAIVPSNGYGNLKLNQIVQVNLDCYPPTQYGFIYGKIIYLGDIIIDGGYKVKIYVSSYQPTLRVRLRLQELTGTVQITTAEYTFIQKIFH